MGDADYLYAFQKLVMPIAYEYAPELVISRFSKIVCLLYPLKVVFRSIGRI
jgi:hypothetical protein